MKIHEYQAKALLRDFGVPVPGGAVASTPEGARSVAEEMSRDRYVVKAQIHAGGRGKGGGIKLASSPDEVEKVASEILGMTLVTPQTGPHGRLVQRVLVESGVAIDRELYLGVVVDRETTRTIVMGSKQGGVEIEEIAARDPEAIVREPIDPLLGIRSFQARRLAQRLGLDGELARPASALIANVVRAFAALDATIVEINPLVVTVDGELLALDCKVNLDDNALFRHSPLAELRDINEEDPLEVEASEHGLSYIKLDGDIGCMVNGAGLAMATMDIIQLAGRAPANFLDVGGGADVGRISNAFRILTSDQDVRAVLINIFGGIVRCDRVAEGIIAALETVPVEVPIVVRLEGTNATEARAILASSGRNFIVADSLADAANKVMTALDKTAKGPS